MSFSVFRHWLLESRAGVGPVVLGDKGVFARDAIAKNDMVASVPADLVITEAMARKSPAGRPLAEAKVMQSEAFFAAFLLRERGRKESFWAPYIAQIPASFTGMPHYHGSHLSPLLVGTRALQIIRHNVQWARAAHQLVVRSVPTFKDMCLDDFLWGYFAACSRTFSAQVGGEKIAMLAPLMDAFNVAIEANAVWRCDVESGDCSVTAARDIRPNEEIRVSCGNKSNTALFTRYGITLPDNPVKEALLSLDGVADEGHTLRVRNDFDDTEAPRVFATLRKHGSDTRADLDAEREVLMRIQQAALAQQRQILTSHPAPSPELEQLFASVARVCADERAALDWWIALTNTALAALDLTGEARLAAITRLAEESPAYRAYARQLLGR